MGNGQMSRNNNYCGLNRMQILKALRSILNCCIRTLFEIKLVVLTVFWEKEKMRITIFLSFSGVFKSRKIRTRVHNEIK